MWRRRLGGCRGGVPPPPARARFVLSEVEGCPPAGRQDAGATANNFMAKLRRSNETSSLRQDFAGEGARATRSVSAPLQCLGAHSDLGWRGFWRNVRRAADRSVTPRRHLQGRVKDPCPREHASGASLRRTAGGGCPYPDRDSTIARARILRGGRGPHARRRMQDDCRRQGTIGSGHHRNSQPSAENLGPVPPVDRRGGQAPP